MRAIDLMLAAAVIRVGGVRRGPVAQQTILGADDGHGQGRAAAEEDEEGPFPAERVDGDDEEEPVDELGVGEEVECAAVEEDVSEEGRFGCWRRR